MKSLADRCYLAYLSVKASISNLISLKYSSSSFQNYYFFSKVWRSIVKVSIRCDSTLCPISSSLGLLRKKAGSVGKALPRSWYISCSNLPLRPPMSPSLDISAMTWCWEAHSGLYSIRVSSSLNAFSTRRSFFFSKYPFFHYSICRYVYLSFSWKFSRTSASSLPRPWLKSGTWLSSI